MLEVPSSGINKQIKLYTDICNNIVKTTVITQRSLYVVSTIFVLTYFHNLISFLECFDVTAAMVFIHGCCDCFSGK